MDWSVPAIAFCAFFGGLLLVSSVLAWIAGFVEVFKSSGTEGRGLGLAQMFLHSGPWSLALAIAAVYYVSYLSRPSLLWALLGGFGAAAIFLAAAVSIANWRRRHAKNVVVPLTPERLAKIRRRFFWLNTMYFGGTIAAVLLYQMWTTIGGGFIVFILSICVGGGYAFSWFMWQWYGAALQAREEARRREERHAV